MKKIVFIIIICIMIVCLFSCVSSGINGVTTDSDSDTTDSDCGTISTPDWVSQDMIDKDFFDYSKTHKPSDEDMQQINHEMYLKEVIDILGRPHNAGPTSGITTLEWETEEGNVYFVYLFMDSKTKKVPDESIFNYYYENATTSPAYLYSWTNQT